MSAKDLTDYHSVRMWITGTHLPERTKQIIGIIRNNPNVLTMTKPSTLLAEACYQNDLEMVILLLRLEADPNLCGVSKNKHPLRYALINKNNAILECLIRAGAQVNFADEEGRTPLMIAVSSANYDGAKLLIDAGADVNAKDYNGDTVIMTILNPYLWDRPKFDEIQLLLDSRADVHCVDSQGINVLAMPDTYRSKKRDGYTLILDQINLMFKKHVVWKLWQKEEDKSYLNQPPEEVIEDILELFDNTNNVGKKLDSAGIMYQNKYIKYKLKYLQLKKAVEMGNNSYSDGGFKLPSIPYKRLQPSKPITYETQDSMNICRVGIPFKTGKIFISNLYGDPRETKNVVDFPHIDQTIGFLYVADTTGHNYSSVNNQAKKKQLSEFWKGFNHELKTMLEHKKKIQGCRWKFSEMKQEIQKLLGKKANEMSEIGKESTLSCAILVELETNMVTRKKYVVTINLGDSVIFKVNKTGSIDLLTLYSIQKNVTMSRSASIQTHPLNQGDMLVAVSDGLLDHIVPSLKNANDTIDQNDKVKAIKEFELSIKQFLVGQHHMSDHERVTHLYVTMFRQAEKLASEKFLIEKKRIIGETHLTHQKHIDSLIRDIRHGKGVDHIISSHNNDREIINLVGKIKSAMDRTFDDIGCAIGVVA